MDFKLVDEMGNDITEAGVQGLLIYKGGTVCDDDFNERAADLICQSMGWHSAAAYTSSELAETESIFRVSVDQYSRVSCDLGVNNHGEVIPLMLVSSC